MADENMNNNNEETAALFVSAQKKKKAEEEARQKAAEEQAKRDAAEAEIRRMEEEVEERKRKAEEEKKALEEAEAAKAAGAGENVAAKAVEKATAKVAATAADAKAGKLPLPMPALIGIAAAVVVLIIILVVALGGKGKGGASSEAILAAEFKAQYATKAAGYEMSFAYPEEIYPNVTEAEEDGLLSLEFASDKKGTYPVQVLVASLADNGTGVTRGSLTTLSPKELLKLVTDAGAGILESEGVTVVDQTSTDLAAEVPQKYFDSISFTKDGGENGAAYCWVRPGANEAYMLVTALCIGKGDPAELQAVCEKFVDQNSADALMVPGAKPPTSTEIDGMLTVDDMHMGIHMPNGQFVRCPGLDGDGCCVFGDANGAMILVAYSETDVDFDTAGLIRDDVYAAYKSQAESGLGSILPYVEGRMFLDDAQNSMNRYEYYANYKDTISGITYWEGFYANHWRDVRTQKYYFYEIIMLAPELNKEVYYNLFMKSLDRLDDI